MILGLDTVMILTVIVYLLGGVFVLFIYEAMGSIQILCQ